MSCGPLLVVGGGCCLLPNVNCCWRGVLSLVGIVACLLVLFRVDVGVDDCCRCCLRDCSSSVVVYVCGLRLYGVGVCCCGCAALFVVGRCALLCWCLLSTGY